MLDTVWIDRSRISRSVTGWEVVDVDEDAVVVNRSTRWGMKGLIVPIVGTGKQKTYCRSVLRHGSEVLRELGRRHSFLVWGILPLVNYNKGWVIELITFGVE